jgi:hypothetical protein
MSVGKAGGIFTRKIFPGLILTHFILKLIGVLRKKGSSAEKSFKFSLKR